MNPPRWSQGATSLQMLWRMGGRVCDLPGELLDSLAATVRTAPSRPAAVDRAQRHMDTQADGEAVAP